MTVSLLVAWVFIGGWFATAVFALILDHEVKTLRSELSRLRCAAQEYIDSRLDDLEAQVEREAG